MNCGKTVQTELADFSKKKKMTKEEIFSMKRKAMEKLVNEYIDDCEMRLSPLTVRSYRSALRFFCDFLGKVLLTNATLIDIRRYLNQMKRKKRCRSTISIRLAAIRSFYKYLETYHSICIPFLSEIDLLDYPLSTWEGKGQEALNRQEVRALLEAPDNLRDVLIIAMMYYLGLREHEVTLLKITDVDTIERTMKVLGKGNKPRIVPYSSTLDRALELWLSKERGSYVTADGPYLFPSMHGEQLTTNAVYRIVHKWAQKSGIQRIVGERADDSRIYRVHPHILRHSYARHSVEDNIPLNLISKMMGHSSLNMTLRYAGENSAFKPYHERFKGV